MNPLTKSFHAAIATLLLAWPANLLAQGDNVFIEENHISKNDAGLIAKAQALKDAGKLVLDLKKVAAALAKPSPEAVALPGVSRIP